MWALERAGFFVSRLRFVIAELRRYYGMGYNATSDATRSRMERLGMKPELAPELVEYCGVDYLIVWDFCHRNPPFVCKSWQELLQGRVAWHLVALKERYCFHCREDDQPCWLRALRDEYAVICDFRACDLYNV